MKKLIPFLMTCVMLIVLVACGGDSQPAEEQEGVLRLSVSGMFCERCEALIRREVSVLEGINSVTANYITGEVVIEHEPDASLDAVRNVIILEGFGVND